MNSFFKIQGDNANNILSRMNHSMSHTGGVPGSTNKRSVVIERNRINSLTPADSFELITNLIAKTIDFNREEVENALIKTGCPKRCRLYNRKKFNATVQNKLVDPSPEGEEFRNYMTLLVSQMYGKRLANKGFFRSNLSEQKVGNNSDIVPETVDFTLSSEELPSVTGENITGLQKTADGGVTETEPKDWGSILSGSAQLVNSIGGVIGMFTGGQQASTGSSVLDNYSTNFDQQLKDEEEKNKRTRNIIIVGLVVVAVVVGVIIYMRRKK